ncbi:MAG: hypothetical protein OXF62_21830 [Caldilineaceae bacterium]|nr:hypothetical protein [Caldilineaceae bacterium]
MKFDAEDDRPAKEKPPALMSAAAPGGPTVEQALYALLFLLALSLRLYGLGISEPISPWEAAQIWPAWLAHSYGLLEASRLPDQGAPVSPLLFSLQRGIFFLTGGGNAFWARLVPAAAGAGLVLAAWTLRSSMGRGGALMAAFLFVFDPWLLSFSRMADSATLSLLTAIPLLGWLFDDSNKGNKAIWLPAAVGLFLISGPLAWLLLPTLVFALVLRYDVTRNLLADGVRGRTAPICLGTMLLGATGFLANFSGLSLIGESVGLAIEHLFVGSYGHSILHAQQAYPLNWALLSLLVDEPFLILFGGIGLFFSLAMINRPFSGSREDQDELGLPNEARPQNSAQTQLLRVLAGGVGWGLMLILLPGRTPVSLLVLGLPLLLLAAGTATTILRFGLTKGLYKNEGSLLTLATMGILLVTSFFWTGNLTESLRTGSFDLRLTAFYLLIPALGVFLYLWAGARAGGQAFGLLFLAAIFLVQASSSWKMNLRPEANQVHSLFAEVGDEGVAQLAEDVTRLSFLRAGKSTTAPVYLHVKPSHLPFFAWHLRSMRDLRWQPGSQMRELEGDALVVSQRGAGSEGERLNLPSGYIGSSYAATQRWLPTDLVGAGPLLRWILLRERGQLSRNESDLEAAELWVRRE